MLRFSLGVLIGVMGLVMLQEAVASKSTPWKTTQSAISDPMRIILRKEQ